MENKKINFHKSENVIKNFNTVALFLLATVDTLLLVYLPTLFKMFINFQVLGQVFFCNEDTFFNVLINKERKNTKCKKN